MLAVHITAVCPSCENSYQVDPSLRGKQMRCPDPQCRAVFTVGTAEPPPATKTIVDGGKQTGVVGDMVPLLSVEPESAAASWQAPPPIRRPANPPIAAPQPVQEPEPPPVTKAKPPEEAPQKTWEPPPVRRKPETEAAIPVEKPLEPTVHEYDPPPPRGKRMIWIVTAFAVGVALLLGVGGYFVWTQIIYTEANLAKAAEVDYKEGKYAQAGDAFNGLVVHFPNSDRRSYYQLMQGLCEVRSQANAPEPDVTASLNLLDKFIDDHKDKDAAILKEKAPDLAAIISGLAKSFADRNVHPTDNEPLDVANRLEASLAKVAELEPSVPSSEERGVIVKNLSDVRQAVALSQRIREAIVRLKTAAEGQPATRAVRDYSHRLKEELAALPEIAQQPEVSQLRDQVYARHIEGVRYNPEGVTPPAPAHDGDEARIPSLLVDPLLQGGLGIPPADDSVVLAVVRGVLYALNRTTGQTEWAVRVGVDTTDLPVRVPAQVGLPERILVTSADAKTVTALDANGDQVWQYRMGAECLGRPLIVDQLAYLATYDGKIHEIELAQGKLLGVFDLGQPLTVGGVREPNTSLLYFPADDFCVYVLDVATQPKKCVAILYTNHPAGSLRSEPLILSAPDAEGTDSDWLVLNEAEGLHSTRLHVYHLPITDREEPSEKLDLKPIPGWTWFPPFHDGEKLTMIGDAGVLGIFGIRQARNPKDPLLFPMLPEYFNVGPTKAAVADAHSRAETAAVRDRDYWLLAGGELKRLYLELTANEGPRMKPAAGWEAPLLGSPLHATQVVKDSAGASLILVTQPMTRQTCLATAVDDKKGDILWQRQLGFVCRGEPLALRPAGAKGAPMLLALDRGGGLYAFDPARRANLGDSEWHENDKSLSPALDDRPGAPPVLLPAPDNQSAYEIACPGDGKKLTIRHVMVNPAGGALKADVEHSVVIQSPLGGTPIVTDSMMVLPLANGVLARLTLPLEAEPNLTMGPNWSSKKTPQEAVCRLAALGSHEFLASDGGRGLTHWQWPEAKNYFSLPKNKDPDAPTLKLPEGSLTADPVALPEVKDKPRQVCIADVTGAVALVTVAGDGSLKPGMRWKLGGQITTGPYIEVLASGATRIACVIDNHQLIWLDPEKETILWTHQGNARAALVGRSRLVGDRVVVADDSGLIVGLDPEKGTAIGESLQLPGSTAPAASPVAFGDDRLFTPLSDGTILLPPLKRMDAKK